MTSINQIVNKGIYLLDDATRYIKTCGKRSMLEKPLQVKINPKEFGYICPNGDIQFQSTEIASKYAKNWVMQPLKSKNPYERFVAQRDNVIFFQKDGTKYSTDIDDIDIQKILSRFDSNISITHGHPNIPNLNFASPLTPQDCISLHKNKAFKDIVAYDQQGNFSKLSKKDATNELPPNFLQKFENEIAPKKLMQRQNALLEKMNVSSLTSDEEKELFEIFDELQKLSCSEQIAKNAHRFWVNNAEKMGLDYSTNYSWLG